MKLLIASDIHGSAFYCDLLLRAFAAEQADRLLLLGDILYHGPRNDLPEDYAPKKVITQLSAVKEKIFCVRGNCDTEVDQMVLPFPMMADYAVIPLSRQIVYATHGHIWHPDNPPPLMPGDILLHGHTHVPARRCFGPQNAFTYWNPGSVSLPKENTPHSYMLLETDHPDSVVWKNLKTGDSFLP